MSNRESNLTPAAKRDLKMLREGTKRPNDLRYGPWCQLFNAGFGLDRTGNVFTERWDEARESA